MREIKFRAWDKEHNCITEPFALNELSEHDGFECGAAEYHDWYEIGDTDSFIVMQFTGLRDKNGKEIYEGDLLISQTIYIEMDNDITTVPCIVEWLNKLACFVVRKNHCLVPLRDIWQPSIFEVIGNIYENPELLEEPEVAYVEVPDWLKEG